MKILPIFVLSLTLSMSAARGHEFWISPEEYELASGADIVAALRTGQQFSGGPFSFLPPRFERFDLVQGDLVMAVEGRVGDRPALNMVAPGDGLWVVVHETKDSNLTWKEWEKFAGFVEHKKLGNALAEHVDRGLPDVGFKERYRRFVKALIGVGIATGADRPVGMRTEIVALANPYTEDVLSGFPVQVFYEGAPRVGAQIEVFEKNDAGEVAVFTLQTDSFGKVVVPVKPAHEYLLDAVILLPLDPGASDKDAVWESLWAALTFRVPG